MPTSRQIAIADNKQAELACSARRRTYCKMDGSFDDELLYSEFASAKGRVATMKSAMLLEAPALIASRQKHVLKGRYLPHFDKAMYKHGEMEAAS